MDKKTKKRVNPDISTHKPDYPRFPVRYIGVMFGSNLTGRKKGIIGNDYSPIKVANASGVKIRSSIPTRCQY